MSPSDQSPTGVSACGNVLYFKVLRIRSFSRRRLRCRQRSMNRNSRQLMHAGAPRTIYVIGPGHEGPALVSHAYLEGTYSESMRAESWGCAWFPGSRLMQN